MVTAAAPSCLSYDTQRLTWQTPTSASELQKDSVSTPRGSRRSAVWDQLVVAEIFRLLRNGVRKLRLVTNACLLMSGAR